METDRELQELRLEDLDLDDFDEWYQKYHDQLAVKSLRRENPYAADIAKELLRHSGGLHRSWVITNLENARSSKGLAIPLKFEATIQSAFNQHCVDSLVFQRSNRSPADGIFYSPNGKGTGYWAVYPDKAKAWIARKVRQAEECRPAE